jgi:hypothetical protein
MSSSQIDVAIRCLLSALKRHGGLVIGPYELVDESQLDADSNSDPATVEMVTLDGAFPIRRVVKDFLSSLAENEART